MEEKGVSFTGITQATSDLDCRDGDLSISHNIINQDGAMRPIIAPNVAFSLNAGEQLLYIHKGDGYKNYIVSNDTSILFFSTEKILERKQLFLLNGRKVKQVVSIGNSVAILFEDGIEYLLYEENSYKMLGSKPPELQISFGLVGSPKQVVTKNELRIGNNTDKYIKSAGIYPFNAESAETVTSTIYAKISELSAGFRNANMFVYPFLVCFAYKLLGTTDYMVSQPVVMQPVKSGSYPFIPVTAYSSQIGPSGTYRESVVLTFDYNIIMHPCQLDYRIDKSLLEQLKEWKDIITSVDIFVSPEIQTYKDNERIVCFMDGSKGSLAGPNMIGCSFGSSTRTPYDSEQTYERLKPIYAHQGNVDNLTQYTYALEMPCYTSEEIEDKIKSTANFYLYKSYNIDDLKTAEIVKPEEKDILSNLALRQELKAVQDYNSHDIIAAEKAIIYNSRLHLSGVRKTFFGFNPAALVPYNNGERTDHNIFAADNYVAKTYDYKMTYLINEDGKHVKTVSGVSKLNNVDGFLFYPNPKVVKVLTERITPTETKYAEDSYESHEYLNDSISISNERLFRTTYNAADYNVGTQAYDYNKVYTSDVNSIFNFPLSGRTTIGTGTVLGVGAISKALSPGQFGQFPLYAFSTEGVYAMEVNPNTGLFSSVHLISRDVCNNANSITQIDGAVLFTSEKGVLIVDGSDVRPISAEMDGPNYNIANTIQLNEVLNKEGVLNEIGSMLRFPNYISSCQMAYDYPNNRIVLFRPDMPYAYVYSLNSRSWATLSSNYKHVVNDYPSVYLQSNSNQVYDLFEKVNYDSGKEVKTIILSRPLKLGDAEYKSINTIINRGLLKKDRGAIILFASLDGITYFPIGSAIGHKLTRLQGSPYRYFRLAIVGNMAINEALSMSSIFITSKWNKKPR